MSNDIVKKRFVAEVLKARGRDMIARQDREIRKKIKFHSNKLVDTRRVKVASESDAYSGNLSYVHVDYERFLDLKRGRRADGKRVKRRRIHNRFVMGAYYSIARDLMFGLTEDVISRIRSEMGVK